MSEEMDWICQNCGKVYCLKDDAYMKSFDKYPPVPIKCSYCNEERKDKFCNMIIRDSKGTKLPFSIDRENDVLWVKIPEINGTVMIYVEQFMDKEMEN